MSIELEKKKLQTEKMKKKNIKAKNFKLLKDMMEMENKLQLGEDKLKKVTNLYEKEM